MITLGITVVTVINSIIHIKNVYPGRINSNNNMIYVF